LRWPQRELQVAKSKMVGYFWDTIKTVQAAVPKKIVNAQLVHNISQRSEMIDVYGYIEHNRTISPGHHFFMEVQIGTIWMALQKGIKKRGFQSYFWGTPIYGWFILWNIL
jgi:ubiquitin C-terminal hydrolase